MLLLPIYRCDMMSLGQGRTPSSLAAGPLEFDQPDVPRADRCVGAKIVKEKQEEQVQEDEKHEKLKVDIAATQNELSTAKACGDRETSNQQQLTATLTVQVDQRKAD